VHLDSEEEEDDDAAAAAAGPGLPRVVSQGALRVRAAAAAAGGGLSGAAGHAARVAARRGSGTDYSWAPEGKPSRALSMVRLQTEANRNLTGVEARDQGNVSGRVIKTYISAGGGWLIVGLIVALMALEQGTRVFTDTWLGFWSTNRFKQDLWFYLGIYAGCGVAYSLIVYLR
jgi:ATP-binding cassette subfamily C (CFTR/MRP) protein 1